MNSFKSKISRLESRCKISSLESRCKISSLEWGLFMSKKIVSPFL